MRKLMRELLFEYVGQGCFANFAQEPCWENMEITGENAAVILDDQVLVAGGVHGAAIGLARLQLVHDAVEEADGDTTLVMRVPLVEDGDEEIAPLVCGDGEFP